MFHFPSQRNKDVIPTGSSSASSSSTTSGSSSSSAPSGKTQNDKVTAHQDKITPVPPDGNYEKKVKQGTFKGTYYPDGSLQRGELKFASNAISGSGKVSYTGEFKNNQMQGVGKLNYSSGESYEGEFVDGKRHGKGKMSFLIYNKRETISGEFENDQLVTNKDVIWKFPEGFYEGKIDVDNKKMTPYSLKGTGKLVILKQKNFDTTDHKNLYSPGIYEGEFSHSRFQKGKIHQVGEEDQKKFDELLIPKNKPQNGSGQFEYVDGVYKGDFVDGKREGRGVFHSFDGSVYVGDFKDDKMEGKGVLTLRDIYKYEGEFRNNMPDGKGKESHYNYTYEGEYKEGKLHGKGKLVVQDQFPCSYIPSMQHANKLAVGVYTGTFENGNCKDVEYSRSIEESATKEDKAS